MSLVLCYCAYDGKGMARPEVGQFHKIAPWVNKALDKDDTYYISFDQSTTCTGIYLTNTDLDFHVVFDFKRESTDVFEYQEQLFKFIKMLVSDLNIKMAVMEEPVQSYAYAGRVLREFKGFLTSTLQNIQEFDNVPLNTILTQSWKSQIMIKKKGKGRFNNKSAIAEDIVDRVPDLKIYYNYHASKDYDGLEAVGILHGYLKKHYDEHGNKLATTTGKNIEHSYHVFCKELTPEQLRDEKTLFKGLEPVKSKVNPQILKYNLDYSFYENLFNATSECDFAIMLITNETINLKLHWEFDIDLNPNKVMVLFCIRKTLRGKNIGRLGLTKTQLVEAKKHNYYMYVE